MNIYFAASISGGRAFLSTYTKIVEYLKKSGHTIPSEHIIDPNVLNLENQFTDQQIYERDVEWIENADCLIAEVSNPSLGVGYEIGYALNLGKPVLCLCHEDIFLTRMLTGNLRKGLSIKFYKDDEWKNHIDVFTGEIANTKK